MVAVAVLGAVAILVTILGTILGTTLLTILGTIHSQAKVGRSHTSAMSQSSLVLGISSPPNKLAGLYRRPMIITAINRPDIFQGLYHKKDFHGPHTSRLRVFMHLKEMTIDEVSTQDQMIFMWRSF